MINPNKFLKFLKRKKITFFTGVPDSLLKNFLEKVGKLKKKNHIVATSEGSAVAIASGYFLSKKQIPCVYLQNSGLGNAINPLTSIAHQKVYSIPILLIIGWRGEPGVKDEPQHMVKGSISQKLLRLMSIRYLILTKNTKLESLNELINYAKRKQTPVALLVRKNTFEKIKKTEPQLRFKNNLFRQDIIEIILDNISKNDKIISTTGYTSRELFQIRKNKKKKKGKDFYMVGGMGHSASLSIGAGLNSKKKIICLDGDGSILMHLGSLSTAGYLENKNFIHFMFNNNSHESVGGQKILSDKINYKNLVFSLGYKKYFKLNSKKNIENKIRLILKSRGPVFINVIIKNGTLQNLTRPKELHLIKKNFIK